MTRLHGRMRMLQQRLHVERPPVWFWVDTGDGFVRRGDQALSVEEFRRLHGDSSSFTLSLGDRELECAG